MNTKLTLSIDKKITERAKRYARKKKTSLSKLIENQLDILTASEMEVDITPLVKSISGVVDVGTDTKKTKYADYLKRKYS